MFESLGKFVVRNRTWVVLGWLVLALFMVLCAPSLSEVGTADETSFLPMGSESIRAREVIAEKFPDEAAVGSSVLVFHSSSGLTDEDLSYAQGVQDWLGSEQAPEEVDKVVSIFDHPEMEQLLVSPDNTTMLMQVDFNVTAFETKTNAAVETIREHIKDAPAGLEVHLSGQAGIGADFMSSIIDSTHRTTLIAIILIIVVLLVIYRSPVASLVPLITIAAAFLISRGVLGYVADAGVKIPSLLDSFLVVLIFGVGTDYCLFIISRFREELRHHSRHDAAIETMSKVGAVITASAATVFIGLCCLAVARFGLTRTIGPSMGFTVVVTLIAALTLAPALMSIFGRRLFWPFPEMAKPRKRRVDWQRIAGTITRRPALTAVAVLVILLIPYLALPHMARSFDIISELPDDMDSVRGFQVLEGHFDKGEIMPTTVLIEAPQAGDLTSPACLADIARLTATLEQVEGVQKMRSVVQPSGNSEMSAGLTVSGQLESFSQQLAEVIEMQGSLEAILSQFSIESFLALGSYLSELGQTFPWVSDDPNYQDATEGLSQLNLAFQQIVGAAGSLPPAQMQAAWARLQDDIGGLIADLQALAVTFNERGDAYFLPQSMLAEDPAIADMLSVFFSEDGTTTRFYAILEADLYSMDAFDTVLAIRKTLDGELSATSLSGAEHYVGGPTAEFTDIRHIVDEDFKVVMALVLAGVFIVLALLLRSLVAPIYLLLATILGYGATMGLVTWLLQDALGQGGVNYVIPILIFVLILAIGADYNIFFMSRVREESEGRNAREGVRRAATYTSGVIIACGIILAGTFSALTSAPIQMLLQVGAAIAIGVLIHTFVIMSFLVPAIAAVMGRWNWWPASLRSEDGNSQGKVAGGQEDDSIGGNNG